MPSSKLVLLPYKLGSVSAKLLANGLSQRLGLKVRRVKHAGAYRPRLQSIIVNYGSSIRPQWWPHGSNTRVLNLPDSVAIAGNKLHAFKAFSSASVPTVEWTADRAVAEKWVRDGGTLVCRTLLNAHSGRGIVLASSADQLVYAPLYTRYKKKKKEFRVHVFRGNVIDVTEKRKKRDENQVREDNRNYIRNHSNGWMFCRDNINEPGDLRTLARSATNALSLDFGAVDIIWNEYENKCYVLEVNTAPGLEGTTLQRYIDAIYSWQQGL